MNRKREIIAEICSAQSPLESALILDMNKELLEGWNFILTTDAKTNIPICTTEKKFSNGAVVANLFSTQSLVFLNEKIVKKMKTGNADIAMDYSIALDNQIVSYLKPYLNYTKVAPPFGYDEIFNFLAGENVNVDAMPYINENIPNIIDPINIDKIRIILASYEVLRTIDKKKYKDKKVICSIFNEQEINNSVLKTIETMIELSKDNENIKYVMEPYNLRYCLLLKMILIQLKSPKRKRENKLMEFYEFCHYELSTMPLRELKIASEYYINGKQLGFFDKIQKDSYDLIYNIKNMAWDLYHVADLERRVRDFRYNGEIFFIPALLTMDRRFIEILQMYSLKAIAFSDKPGEILPVYDSEKLMDSLESQYNFEKFFSDSFKKEREIKRESVDTDIIIKKLEEEAKKYIRKQ